MRQVILNISDSQIEESLLRISRQKNQTINKTIESIILDYFSAKEKSQSEMSLDVYLKLIKKSEEDDKEDKVTSHEDLERELSNKISAEEFTEKWRGFLKGVEIEDNYRDEYFKYIEKKHQ